jgi:hypothetical protein
LYETTSDNGRGRDLSLLGWFLDCLINSYFALEEIHTSHKKIAGVGSELRGNEEGDFGSAGGIQELKLNVCEMAGSGGNDSTLTFENKDEVFWAVVGDAGGVDSLGQARWGLSASDECYLETGEAASAAVRYCPR